MHKHIGHHLDGYMCLCRRLVGLPCGIAAWRYPSAWCSRESTRRSSDKGLEARAAFVIGVAGCLTPGARASEAQFGVVHRCDRGHVAHHTPG
jgi:hypothetical protein